MEKVLNLNETLKLIVEWNNTYVNNYKQLTETSLNQIQFFLNKYNKFKNSEFCTSNINKK